VIYVKNERIVGLGTRGRIFWIAGYLYDQVEYIPLEAAIFKNSALIAEAERN